MESYCSSGDTTLCGGFIEPEFDTTALALRARGPAYSYGNLKYIAIHVGRRCKADSILNRAIGRRIVYVFGRRQDGRERAWGCCLQDVNCPFKITAGRGDVWCHLYSG